MARPDQKSAYPNIPRPHLNACYDCLGIWLVAFRANHSCLAIIERSFLSDFLLVRVNKDIPKGEEITMSHVPITGKLEHEKMDLWNWNHRYDCNYAASRQHGAARTRLR
jgi:hypothetical protein